MQPVPAVHVDINKERARTRLLAAFDGEHQDAERVAIMCVAGLFARERGFLNDRQQRLASAEWAGDGRTSGAVRRVDARPKRHDVDNGQGTLSLL